MTMTIDTNDTTQIFRSHARRIEWPHRVTMRDAFEYDGDNKRVVDARNEFIISRDSGVVIPRLIDAIISLSRNHAAYESALRMLSVQWADTGPIGMSRCRESVIKHFQRLTKDDVFTSRLAELRDDLGWAGFKGEVDYPTVCNPSADPRSIIPDDGPPVNVWSSDVIDGEAQTCVILHFSDELMGILHWMARSIKTDMPYEHAAYTRQTQEIIDSYGGEIENYVWTLVVSKFTLLVTLLIKKEKVYQFALDEIAAEWDDHKLAVLEAIEDRLRQAAKEIDDDDPDFISRIVTWAKSHLDPHQRPPSDPPLKEE